MSKDKIIILIVIILVIVAGIVAFNLLQKGKNAPAEPLSSEQSSGGNEQEVVQPFGFSAKVLSIDAKNSFLIVRPENTEDEVKLIVKEGTILERIINPKEMPEHGGVFTAAQEKVNISDFKNDDLIYLTTETDFSGKTEIDDIKTIRIIP